MAYVGAPLRRREDRRLLTGASRFLDDIRLPGMVHAAIVRSPHAHARILRLEPGAARAMPGVVAVLTPRDLPSPIPRIPAPSMFPGIAAATHPLLAEEIVRYVGQPVAVIVAGQPLHGGGRGRGGAGRLRTAARRRGRRRRAGTRGAGVARVPPEQHRLHP